MKMDLREVGLEGMDWWIWYRIGRGIGALVNAVMNLRVP